MVKVLSLISSFSGGVFTGVMLTITYFTSKPNHPLDLVYKKTNETLINDLKK